MVESQATISVVVAFIGVVGAILPIYITSVFERDYSSPNVNVRVEPNDSSRERNFNQFAIGISNIGNAPATNLSVIMNAFPAMILNVTNKFSTTELTLPQFDNSVLKQDVSKTINRSLLEIQTPRLVHGRGSAIELEIFTNFSSGNDTGRIYAVYDQGSERGESFGPEPLTITDLMREFTDRWLASFYFIFYAALAGLVLLYVTRRKRSRTSLLAIARDILRVRGVLRDNRNSKEVLYTIWHFIPGKQRKYNHHIGDYLLIDDFYSELSKRNLYLKNRESTIKDSVITKLNETCLAAAEKALKDIDWNKYR